MSFQSPPKVLRIKRKRDQDPLQALILEDRKSLNHKRSKPSSLASSVVLTPLKQKSELDLTHIESNQKLFHESLLFTLARTDVVDLLGSLESVNGLGSEEVLQSVLSEAPAGSTVASGKRNFIIPKRQLEEDTVIPNELSDMLGSFLNVEPLQLQPKKRRNRNVKPNSVNSAGSNQPPPINVVEPSPSPDLDSGADEYVYDVYHLSSSTPLTTANHPLSTIGYIRFFDDEDNTLYQSDEDQDERTQLSDDEDSNAEDFYQNDYPSDEDEQKSIFDGEEDEEEDEGGEEGEIVLIHPSRADEVEEGFDYLESQDVKDGEFDDIYDQFYDDDDEFDEDGINFLDEDHFEDEEETFQRNNFFADDEQSELAIHRDRIFGKLQKMIDERN